ncbi:MAG: hypothetical protein ABIK89_20560, partial [Planctomycetota bacterium]
LKVIDDIVREPPGGAHRDHHLMASTLKMYLRSKLRELVGMPVDELLEARYQRFRRMGVFLEGADAADADHPADGQPASDPSNGKPASETTEPAKQPVDSRSI